MKFVPLLLLLAVSLPGFSQTPTLKVRPQTIDSKIQIGYGLAIADVDGDGKPDILLADAKQIVWYRNPGWEKFVMAENLTPKDNVCIAALDLDGDGKCEVAVGAEWNPNDTVGSGAIFLLEAPADRTQRWKPVQLPHEPTTHRMHWMKDEGGKPFLAVLPLHGRGNKNNAGEGVVFLGYPWPWKTDSKPFPLFGKAASLHATHNFDPIDGHVALTGTAEGLRTVALGKTAVDRPNIVSTRPAGEARYGRTGGANFIATIEPMHGNTLAVYRGTTDADRTSTRLVLDETLNQGHALATGDLLGTGGHQIVVGSRGAGKPSDKFGLKLYAPSDATGTAWKLAAVIDDNQMACEDLKLADLNGDGRPDIIAAGRATKNVVIYWNETPKPAK
ncbi:MAG: FG-GAP and VCBS repeat-containing protein [Verrucomicrobia bacterium]|nr:FG-GAP and VCBS repeat-containing protein [Verrucomicrobiota bacterium]